MKPLVIVSGALANKPGNGGNAWTRLSWVRGFQRLGCEVFFVEQLPPGSLAAAPEKYFREVMEQFGLAEYAALLAGNEVLCGLPLTELVGRAGESALLFNLSGHLTQPDIFSAAPCKVYYDDDPGFTQFWHAAGNAGARLAGHDFHFTIGENIGSPDCVIPTGEIHWRHTRAPVGLTDWPVCPPKALDRFTTIASWRGAFGPVAYGGKTYGLKCHEFRKFFTLPSLVKQNFEVALQIHPADQKDLAALLAHGWKIIEPGSVASSPDDFRRYVQTSGAEFSPAQGIYVDTNSGWFSDRTARYLASGRPALVQETGFSRHIRTGEGLLSFRTLEEAAEGAARIAGDYERHCRAARQVAEEFFDADKIIRQLVVEVGLNWG
jgi:hypothetical protein